MIYNFYSYLFFSAMAAGAAMALLIRTMIDKNRRLVWDVTSITFFILMIISIILLFIGLFIVDPNQFKLPNYLLFFLAFLSIYVVSFYFLKSITLPISLFLLLGSFFTYYYFLTDYSSFSDDHYFSMKVLQINDDLISVELKGFDDSIQFKEISGNQIIPVFKVQSFPDVLFFLESSSFIKFEGFLSELKSDYIGSNNLNLPLSNVEIYSTNRLESSIYSSLKVDLNRNGSIIFLKE